MSLQNDALLRSAISQDEPDDTQLRIEDILQMVSVSSYETLHWMSSMKQKQSLK